MNAKINREFVEVIKRTVAFKKSGCFDNDVAVASQKFLNEVILLIKWIANV